MKRCSLARARSSSAIRPARDLVVSKRKSASGCYDELRLALNSPLSMSRVGLVPWVLARRCKGVKRGQLPLMTIKGASER